MFDYFKRLKEKKGSVKLFSSTDLQVLETQINDYLKTLDPIYTFETELTVIHPSTTVIYIAKVEIW